MFSGNAVCVCHLCYKAEKPKGLRLQVSFVSWQVEKGLQVLDLQTVCRYVNNLGKS